MKLNKVIATITGIVFLIGHAAVCQGQTWPRFRG